MNSKKYVIQPGSRISSYRDLAARLKLEPMERAFFENSSAVHTAPPFSVTEYYFSLIQDGPDDPIRRQCIPSSEEYTIRGYELPDPLGEGEFQPCPRLVHRYPDRVLILVTDQCAVYCRHCFRRNFTGKSGGTINAGTLGEIINYISGRKEIHEVLLSGGDSLMLPDDKLEEILSGIREIRDSIVFRLATRIPAVLPSRITAELTVMLRRYRPLWVVTQFNHPREITDQSAGAVQRFLDAGIPVLNQAVLLRGVNDDVPVLEALFHRLIEIGCKPYYLFQGDLAQGTSRFRVPLSRGLDLYRCAGNSVSGLAMPKYALDLPGGGGKTTLNDSVLSRRKGDWYIFSGPEGRIYRYPEEA